MKTRLLTTGVVTVALCLATFADDAGWVEMSDKAARGWGLAATVALVAFFLLAMFGDEE